MRDVVASRRWQANMQTNKRENQCDQMARLLCQHLAIYKNEILPNSVKIATVGLRVSHKQNKPSNIFQRLVKFCQSYEISLYLITLKRRMDRESGKRNKHQDGKTKLKCRRNWWFCVTPKCVGGHIERVLERERERERKNLCLFERGRKGVWERICVIWERELEKDMCLFERERERDMICVSLREGDRVCERGYVSFERGS